MITRAQVLDSSVHEIHHTGPGGCSFSIGPRGGVRHRVVTARRNGAVKTWITRPEDFSAPFKYGLRDAFRVEPHNASQWCVADDCAPCAMARAHYAHGAGACDCHDVGPGALPVQLTMAEVIAS
jgi:hypothetical protein